MKKIISFSKELKFPTMIGEISSISLDNDLSFTEQNKIEGNFFISGTYKMTEASRIDEEFSYNVPTEIELNENLVIDSINISIDNFTYEVLNDDVLVCKIDVLIEGIESIDIEEEKEILDEVPTINEEIVEEKLNEERECDGEKKEDLDKENDIEEEKEEYKPIELNSLFSNLNDDTFKSYTVYIVRENDTIDKILEKYSITREELSKYNDLDNVSINTKLIIPTVVDNEA